jgi:hypothetical protein
MTALTLAAGLLLGLSSLAMFVFGVNLLYLTWRALRLPAPPQGPADRPGHAIVCVQIPIYNERHVATRVIDAVCRLDWPRGRLEVQVLDDSDDETVEVVGRSVASWRRAGVRIAHLRRSNRTGFKAGALAHGQDLTEAEFIAVFDADFVPPPDFLRRIMPAFADPEVGFAQARWAHLNERYSLFTRLQALAIDFHFLVEQAARSGCGWFTNFTGTAGVWRRRAIDDAGGWSAATLTEDLDLSYRAQLRGWKACYQEAVAVPEELPVDISAYRRQQMRWATGSFQSARLLLPELLSRQGLGAGLRWQGCVHLLSYAVGPLMLAQLACYPVMLLARARNDPLYGLSLLGLAVNVMSLAPWLGFAAAQVRRGRGWRAGIPAVFCQVLGAGFSLTVLRALFRSGKLGGEFERTPKYGIEHPEHEWRASNYVPSVGAQAGIEALLGLAAAGMAVAAVRLGAPSIALYSTVFALGFAAVAFLSAAQAVQVLTLRRLGRRGLRALRRAAAPALLLGLSATLLAVVGGLGDPFEDSYHHWLIAAYLAQTGNLHDPLFAMEDSWLPGYHLLGAALLKLFGFHQFWVLKAASAACALLTLSAVHRLAGGGRRGRLALLLLGLNPIFLLTATSVVAEPLTGALLTGATLAAVRGRTRLAALAAAAACTVATKAWIWLLALAAVELVRALRPALARREGSRPALGWALPALALLAILQLGFAPASHSLARGALEAGSAAARGSLAASPLGRLEDFAGYFALAALPLLALAPAGLLHELRDDRAGARLRLLHLPALIYLGGAMTLVGTGFYTGSHRYYYLALPALAVLAATALDRVPALAGRLALGASALLTVGFIPVFAGFSAGNSGLAAAGRAAAAVPGTMLTDSPVAAFHSGKPPGDIVGSRGLPTRRETATEWLQARGITSVVVEDIDYYRATTVLPDLAAGRPQAPFSRLGEERAYQVPGGKPAYAYILDAGAYHSQVAGIPVELRLQPGGSGKTAGLQKGVELASPAQPRSGEGMGFGVPIIHYPDGWVYSTTALSEDLSQGDRTVWRKTYSLDLSGGDHERPHPFVKVAGRGRVEVTYSLLAGRLQIAVRALDLAPGYDQVVLLNEQSAAFDDFADARRTLVGADFGMWVPTTGSWARLRSASLGLEWSQPALPEARLTAGRELERPLLDWAGLEYAFGPDFKGAEYAITLGRAR